MSDSRFQALHQWLKSELVADFKISPIKGDASFRRYFRVFSEDKTFIAVDAPPEQENSHPFIAVSRSLSAVDVKVPEVFSFDLKNGFMLLTDFGNDLYHQVLNSENVNLLYGKALEDLLKIQTCKPLPDLTLPYFNQDFMAQELLNFRTWFLEQHLEIKMKDEEHQLLTETFEKILALSTSQPQCFIHRDYHSKNLMVLPNNEVGVLDFQDAALGPITYDAVSLLRDCYIVWPTEEVEKWVLSYFSRLQEKGMIQVSSEVFLKWFDWMGVQRHLKAIFIFSRKYHRDDVSDYLQYIPNALSYVMQVTGRYWELMDFYSWMEQVVLPRYQIIEKRCYENV